MTRQPTNPIRQRNVFSLLSLCILSVLMTLSCTHQQHQRPDISQQRAAADSTLKDISDTTRLRQMVLSYKRSHDAVGEMMACKQLGKALRENNCYQQAIDCHQREYALAESLQDTIDMVQALNNIGTNFRRFGVLDEAINYHYRALSLANAYSDQEDKVAKKNKVVSLNGIGNISLTLNDSLTADSVFRAALKGETELGSELGRAINFANLGALFESGGKTDSAWAYYRLSMKSNQAAHSDLGISLCYNHFGRLLEKAGKTQEAISQYEKAYKLMEQGSDKWHWLESCLALARIYVQTGDHAKALGYLSKALAEAEQQQSIEHLAEVYKLYYLIYNKENNCPKALECFTKASEYNDSVNSEKNLVHMQNVRVKYEYERRQGEIDTLNKSYQTERILKRVGVLSTITIALLSVIAVVFLCYVIKSRKQKQKLMEENEKAMTSFFTNITHEFRTPLTVILGHADRMGKGLATQGEIADTGRAISRQGRRLLTLINQILDISKIKAKAATMEWRRGNVATYISMLLDGFTSMAGQRNIEIVYAPKQEQMVIDFVPDYVQKIVCNLMSNAIKFSHPDSNILVTTAIDGEVFTLRIADFGIGMSAEDQKHIFNLYHQNNDGMSDMGSGIGLALVKQITKLLHGTVSVESLLGRGSVFTITLPVSCNEEAKALSIDASEPLPATADPALYTEPTHDETAQNEEVKRQNDMRPVVLIVEDNIDVAEYIQLCLKDQYLVRFAQNGKDGLEKAQQLMPDIIITDLMMPVMDGLQLCTEIRQSDILNHIPVVMVTAKNTDRDRLQGLSTGADAYISKPFNADELTISIDNLLRRQRLLREKYSQAVEEKQEKPEEGLQPKEREFLEKLNQVVTEAMPSGNLSVDRIASDLCMSGQQMRRKLNAITGETPAFYIRRIQMQTAKGMMDQDRDIPINEVARSVGYDDMSHFTRTFKAMYNVTPSQYKNEGQ